MKLYNLKKQWIKITIFVSNEEWLKFMKEKLGNSLQIYSSRQRDRRVIGRSEEGPEYKCKFTTFSRQFAISSALNLFSLDKRTNWSP